jgi:hypothetical protein
MGLWRTAMVVVDHFSDDLAGAEPPADAAVEYLSLARVGLIGDEMVERLPESPASPACPRRMLDRYGFLETRSAVVGEERPGDRKVAGRVAEGGASEVEHTGQAPLPYEQVGAGHITVYPDRGRVVTGGEHGLPHVTGGRRVDYLAQRVEVYASLLVPVATGPPLKKEWGPGAGPAGSHA